MPSCCCWLTRTAGCSVETDCWPGPEPSPEPRSEPGSGPEFAEVLDMTGD